MLLRTVFAIAAFFLAGSTCVLAAEPKDEIKLEKIKAADVEQAIAAHKGKVVVLDVWGEF